MLLWSWRSKISLCGGGTAWDEHNHDHEGDYNAENNKDINEHINENIYVNKWDKREKSKLT